MTSPVEPPPPPSPRPTLSGGVDPLSASPGHLGALARQRGELVHTAGNLPVLLDDPRCVWYVASGVVDVFGMEHADDRPVAGARHLVRTRAGGLLFGLAEETGQMRFVAKGFEGTRLYRLTVAELAELADDSTADELADAVNAWALGLSNAVGSMIEYRPPLSQLVAPGATAKPVHVDASSVVAARSEAVAWLRAEVVPDEQRRDSDGFPIAYLGTERPHAEGNGWLPLAGEGWATITEDAQLKVCSAGELARRGLLLDALDEFHVVALGAERLNRLLLLADEVNEQAARSAHRRESQARATLALASLGPRGGRQNYASGPLAYGARAAEGTAGAQMEEVLRIVGRYEGIEFRWPQRQGAAIAVPSPVEVARASGVRLRQVRLQPGERWWRGDSGTLVGSWREDGRPVALVPTAWNGYRVVESRGNRAKVTTELADKLAPEAWQFYASLPADRPAGARDLLRIATKRIGVDVLRLIIVGLVIGLLAQTPAIVLGILADWVLPFQARGAAVHLIVALSAFSLVGLALGGFSGAMLMRLQGRSAARVGAAAWSRLLSLPPSFFRSTVAGELAQRLGSFQALRDRVSAAVIRALMSLIFVVPTLGILVLYDVRLAAVSIGVGAVSLSAVVMLGMRLLGPLRELHDASRHLGGQLLQLLSGVAKVRAAGGEAASFAFWARGYRDAQAAGVKVARVNEHLVALCAALPALAGAALVAVTLASGTGSVEIGEFLVVYVASMTFLAAVTEIGWAVESLAGVQPAYEQVKPILQAVPESAPAGVEEFTLNGELRLDHVSFRHRADGPLVIDDVSLHVRPGEFVAIVGSSGSGKSTLLRLILGLDEPVTGSVYFDGRDLCHLDRPSVRRQIGTVLQDSGLQPGSLLENIIGAAGTYTVDDAWRAARLAGVEADIRAMPMQLLTPVSDQATTFSGGQVQRIRIAAALVRSPRFVLLDEATSWLDAASQATVMEGIESLAATRIVVAHRLSTIRSADRIYVLEGGKICQQGTFSQLNEEDGPFRDLARRQQI